jgi:hypothetical protein
MRRVFHARRGKQDVRPRGPLTLVPPPSQGGGAMTDPPEGGPPDPEQLWKVLGHTTRLVSHAEGKAALTLAGAAVTGGGLVAAVRTAPALTSAAEAAAVLCGLLLLIAGCCAAVSLWSRVRADGQAGSLLSFHEVAARYPYAAAPYVDALCGLSGDPEQLAAGIAAQVWANAQVAQRKFDWVNRGLAALLGALGLLAATCALLLAA